MLTNEQYKWLIQSCKNKKESSERLDNFPIKSHGEIKLELENQRLKSQVIELQLMLAETQAKLRKGTK